MAGHPGAGDDHGVPRWVKVFGIVALVAVVLLVVAILIGGGDHGPSRHTPGERSNTTSDTSGGHTGPPPGVTHGGQLP
ncbi:MAG: hypothetical protein ACRDNI_08935 [Gaiellaceae bacterium]